MLINNYYFIILKEELEKFGKKIKNIFKITYESIFN